MVLEYITGFVSERERERERAWSDSCSGRHLRLSIRLCMPYIFGLSLFFITRRKRPSRRFLSRDSKTSDHEETGLLTKTQRKEQGMSLKGQKQRKSEEKEREREK